ncbi:MAG: sodium:melibiose symporter [Verrucomicrobia bacterium Tous-C9LFEB]|nr:MAG: sodium:melibiose symporter [Verrucomicrobia bacterium Tous-C9LFEB]
MPPSIPISDRIPFTQKLAFAAGSNTDFISTSMVTGVLWMPFFNIGLGISPAVLGFLLMALRLWDAIIDPGIGSFSDNLRTRWGRRRPLVFIGAITTACLFPFLWRLPQGVLDNDSWLAHLANGIPFISGLGISSYDNAAALYLLFFGMTYFFCTSLWTMPYYAQELEMTPNYDERTRLSAWRAAFGNLAALLGAWIVFLLIFIGTLASNPTEILRTQSGAFLQILSNIQPWLKSIVEIQPDQKPIVVGMSIASWLIAFIILFFGLLPSLFVKERYYEKKVVNQAHDPFWAGIGESLKCVPLLQLAGVTSSITFGMASVSALGQYVNFYYVCRGDLLLGAQIAGLKGSIAVVTCLLMIPVYTWLSEKFDKRSILIFMLGLSIAGHLSNFFLMRPEAPYLQIVSGALESCALAAVWMFLPSMKADVADYDEMQTTRRREGALNAFYSWTFKMAITCALGVGGAVLQLTGFNAKLATQPDHTTRMMFLYYLAIPSIIWGLGLLGLWFYPLNRVRAADIRQKLELRRGAL